MNGEYCQSLVLKVNLPHDIVHRSLRCAINNTIQKPLLCISDTAHDRRHINKLRCSRLLQQRPGGLEQSHRADSVDLEMVAELCDWCVDGVAPPVCNASVGDDNVQVCDAMLGFKGVDG